MPNPNVKFQSVTAEPTNIEVGTLYIKSGEESFIKLGKESGLENIYDSADFLNPIINITYSEIKTLRDNGNLVPGTQYRITDYHCTTTQENTTSADHQFDIIVTADDEKTLNENARACLHDGDTYFSEALARLEAWNLKYCLDNDGERFAWADEDGYGVIYYLKDEWNNECPYDFKNIQFKRKLTDGEYDQTSGTDTWVYTFTGMDENNNYEVGDWSILSAVIFNDEAAHVNCHDNILRVNHSGGVSGYDFALNDIVFLNRYMDMDAAPNCYSNTFGDNCYYNTFGNDCFNNTFGNDCSQNTFGDNCYYNTFGNDCYYNTFGTDCSNNTFGTDCYSNTFGDNCYYNTFGNDCYYNTFGNDCSGNTFGNGCSNNTFGNSSPIDYCQYIVLGDGVEYCKLYGTTTPTDSAYLQNIKVAQGLQGTHNNKLAISIATGLDYETKVAKNSSGVLKIYCEADLIA